MACRPPLTRWCRLSLLVSAVAACLVVLPAQAMELSANAVANERNVIAQPMLAGHGETALASSATAETAEKVGALPMSPTAVVRSSTEPMPVAREQGGASWYARYFHGRRTANGERYDQNELTAAHKTLPFGTVVRVRSEVNGKEVDVRINDRGPFVAGRVIDLSQAAAKALGMLQLGVKRVTLLLPPGLRPEDRDTGLLPAQTAGTSVPTPNDAPTARARSPSIR